MGSPGDVLEEPILDPRFSVGGGYGEAKYVGEKVRCFRLPLTRHISLRLLILRSLKLRPADLGFLRPIFASASYLVATMGLGRRQIGSQLSRPVQFTLAAFQMLLG